MSSAIACGTTVLISYCHKDRRWLDRLEKQLRILMSEGMLTVWNDQSIPTGGDWYNSIQAAIAKADMAILLISADYLTSEFVRHQEIPRLLERKANEGMIIMPVICGPCPWRQVSWLSTMAVRPRDGRPLASFPRSFQSEAELASIAEEVYHLLLGPSAT